MKMDIAAKRRFIEELVETVKARAMRDAARMPDVWDGVELRHYLSDLFARTAFKEMTPTRARNYKYEMLVRNL